jgi:hypothetical protein
MFILLKQEISGIRNNIGSKRAILVKGISYDDVDIIYGSKKLKVEGIIFTFLISHFTIASNEIMITTYQIRQIQ